MHNCIILGSGRSGTSMVTGTLARSGYHLGADLHAARASNPKGFFEAPVINDLNEKLLKPIIQKCPALGDGQRWLGVPVAGQEVKATPQIQREIATALVQEPYCYKDPRFCFTLPAWREAMADTHFVCVFRHPALTAKSMLEECKRANYLQDLTLDAEHVFDLWIASYREVLEKHQQQGEWLFLHYDQVLSEPGLERLGTFLDVDVDVNFPDKKLRRTLVELEAPAEALELYERLCTLAQYQVPSSETPCTEVEVSVLAIITDDDLPYLIEMDEDIRSQRGVSTETIFIDNTTAGEVQVAGVHVVRCTSVSRGAAWQAALAESTGAFVAWLRPGCRLLPSHLAYALEAIESAEKPDLVTCDYYLHDEQGQFVGRSDPSQMGEIPGPFWESGVLMRREVLESISSTAFHPVELKLWQELRARHRIGHVVDPGFSVGALPYRANWDRSRQDGALLTHTTCPFEGRQPQLTVSICTFNRKEVLIECLEAFSRQTLPRGTFEIVLVNDGSSDGTRELLEELELPVPTRIVQRENGGLAAARNSGLEVSTGRLVLFVNDDTIPEPDCIERHLHAHAAFAPGVKGAVLGLFAQPPECLSNALLRYLESSGEVFHFAQLKPHQFHAMQNFYTCNVSVAIDDVRQVGGFDPSFRHYGCEDTDLALRLGELGYNVYYEPQARAIHRHPMDFEYLRGRQHTVAQAYVRLFRKHPKLLKVWDNQNFSAGYYHQQAAQAASGITQQESAAAELAAMDVGSLEALGGTFLEASDEVMEKLAQIIRNLNRSWWNEGFLAGFREHGLAGFHELKPLDPDANLLKSNFPRRLLAWPCWNDAAELDRLMERVQPLVRDGFATLVLRHDPERDPDTGTAFAALEAAYERRFCADPATQLDIMVESRVLTREDTLQLSLAVNALLPLGSESIEFLELIGAERLATSGAVASWRRRFEAPPLAAGLRDATPLFAREGPEISVIIPTHDRPRELKQLIARLVEQDLDPRRFEVIVVDDASQEAVGEILSQVQTPFALQVFTQRAAGPGAARNRGMGHARGQLVVFFNDDAVPAADNLTRHLAAHSARTEELAIMGTFSQLPELQVDSFTRHVESSRALFAQPMMLSGMLYRGLSFCSGNLSISKGLLEKVGGFDESFLFAGGEDSELGIRLERELGTRVLYDDSIRCEHDHVLNVRDYHERMRVIGWAAYRIEAKHEGTGLMTEAPTDPAGWSRLTQQLNRESERAAEVMDSLMATCEQERSSAQVTPVSDAFRELCGDVGEHGFRCGLLAAHTGCLPNASQPSMPRVASA